jgi:hypothetical protein
VVADCGHVEQPEHELARAGGLWTPMRAQPF